MQMEAQEGPLIDRLRYAMYPGNREYAEAWIAFKALQSKGLASLANGPEQWKAVRTAGWLDKVGLLGNTEKAFYCRVLGSANDFRAAHRFGSDICVKPNLNCVPYDLVDVFAKMQPSQTKEALFDPSEVAAASAELFKGQAIEAGSHGANNLFSFGQRYESKPSLADRYCRDDVTAARFYRLAGELGHWESQARLAEMYSEGRGVPEDDVMAYHWLNLAFSAMPEASRQQISETRDKVRDKLTAEGRAEGQSLGRGWRRKLWDEVKAGIGQSW